VIIDLTPTRAVPPPTRLRDDRFVLLHERLNRTRRLGTYPPAFAPHDLDWTAHRRRINQLVVNPAVTVRDDPIGAAANDRRLGLHHDGQRTTTLITFNGDHV
jgi:hypothetical protein